LIKDKDDIEINITKNINNLFFDLMDKFFTILILGYQINKEPTKAGSLK
tara:strand:- start:810 stop:956 length:147 start_codon:yes stop_codon:yes gene_type:complete